jgi:tetratricopeptide (TPR) repeat protein
VIPTHPIRANRQFLPLTVSPVGPPCVAASPSIPRTRGSASLPGSSSQSVVEWSSGLPSHSIPLLQDLRIASWILILLTILSSALEALGAEARPAPSPSQYVGSSECRECHQAFYTLWAPSFHGLAMQPYTPDLARTNLTTQSTPLRVGRYQYQMDLRPNAGLMKESGPDGDKQYPIAHVMGGKNVFYFLTPLDRGFLQVLPVAYDVRRKEWYDTTMSAMRHFTDLPEQALTWKERPLTFNTACYKCHVSQLSNHYDLASDSYRTSWQEPGINCETCHGPGADHARLYRAAGTGPKPADLHLISTKTMSKSQVNDLCLSCHAKMMILTTSFSPGDRFFDHFDLLAWEHQDFYPDGRDLGENYTATSFRESPCVRSGQLDCMHCHTSSGRNRFPGARANEACLPCHAARVQNAPAHTHHPAGSEGNRCVACHLPMTEFARMRRTDHSMRPPAPAATLAFKSPNACNLCHTNETVAWADQRVREWRSRDYQALILERGRLMAEARKSDWTHLPAMLAALQGPVRDEIFTASLVRLLRACDQEAVRPVLRDCLRDPSPLVRASAVEALGDAMTAESIPVLLTATRDEYRLVRIRAATALAGLPAESVPAADREALNRAVGEYEAGLLARPDDALSHYNLGNVHMQRGHSAAAAASFETALRLQPENVAALVNVSLAYNALGKNEPAESSLRQALKLSPTNAAAFFNLGLLLGELGKLAEAESALRSALKYDPQSAAAAYNLGVMLADKNPDEALTYCRKAAALRPTDPKYAYTLAFYLQRGGHVPEAIRVLQSFSDRPTADVSIYALLGQLLESQSRVIEAVRTYRQAANRAQFPEVVRREFQERAQALSNR